MHPHLFMDGTPSISSPFVGENRVINRMELQLCLAIPNQDEHAKGFGFDLNHPVYIHSCSKKRSFADEFGIQDMAMVTPRPPTALPLLIWSKPASIDEKNNKMNNADKDLMAGWPPMKCRRKNNSINGSGSKHVKVKMEGAAIGRKVDLSLHHSYSTLLQTLNLMFSRQFEKEVSELKEQDSLAGQTHGRYRLTYQDADGDWMLVGDVPWGSFIRSVKYLKIQINKKLRATHDENNMQMSVPTRV